MSRTSQSPSRHFLSQNGEPSSSRAAPNWLPPMRYAGDGLDLRRPVVSASPQTDEVIDLTNEPDSPPQQQDTSGRATPRRPRQPRFGRDIMADVVDLEDEPNNTIDLDSPSSPEVQFVGANVRPQLPRPLPSQPRRLDFGAGLVRFLRLDDPRVQDFPGRGLFSRDLGWRSRGSLRRPPDEVETFWLGDGQGGAVDLTINLDMDGPLAMDYQIQRISPDRGSRPAYKPPSPPPEGFTRNLGEDEAVCCPNCDAELGTGDEIQQQIWVVKQCGHVYCGQCATHRSKLNAKKASQPVKPFSKCQVVDCGKTLSAPKAMFQIYL
ncbi:hypothetical protein BDV26DRAFT_289976 [Aspergillus bertholletiae]|uniref:RING-type domain-containing protein n=1 Tax=Aspergillus bertholletiae TaxID=1226010 RepID=A0A5N7BGL1_9EURO|nr:hypothetical protein BDV26DRAFT_289976 [Aspergillus bertholletiae]